MANIIDSNSVEYHLKKIVIDGIIFALQRAGGISSIWADILLELDQHYCKKYKISLLLPKNKNVEWARVESEIHNISIIPRRHFRWDRRSFFIESLYLSRLALKLRADGWHSSYYVGFPLFPKTKRLLMFHDMIPEKTKIGENLYLSRAKKVALTNSDIVHTISHSALRDLQEFYPHLKAKTEVIHNFQRTHKKQIEQAPLPFPYFLYVGKRGGYKNFISCFKHLLEDPEFNPIHIVTVGDDPWTLEEKQIIDRFDASKRVHNLGIVETEKLHALIQHTLLLLYPSLYEGFGLPVLEAFQHNVPILACNTSSIPEVAGSTYPLCNPNEPSTFTEVIHELLKNRKKWAEYGKNRLDLFSVKRTVEQICALW